MQDNTRRRTRRSTIVHLAIAALCTTLAVVGCKDITSLKQQDPGQLSGETVFVPANAQLIVNGVVADFECAYTRYVVGSGLFTDELYTAITRIEDFQYDRRDVPTNGGYGTNDCVGVQIPGIYTPLSVSRASADTAAAALEGWTDEQVPNRQQLIATSYAYGGYSITLLGESMCSAAINLGPELTPAQLFAEAITRFDKAIAAATAASDNTMLQFAQLGRARAKLDAGDLTGAAADAQLISDGFLVATSSDVTNDRRQNAIWNSTISSFFTTVDTTFQNSYAADGDPRIANTSTGHVGTTGDTVYFANKDAAADAPVAIAKWSEAQLIIAENDVANSNVPGAILIINELRRRAYGDPISSTAHAYTGATTPTAVNAEILEQRRREFFLEGHRLGDLRRLNLPFLPAPGAPYGAGGTYGNQTCFPLPDVERINNPNIGGTG